MVTWIHHAKISDEKLDDNNAQCWLMVLMVNYSIILWNIY